MTICWKNCVFKFLSIRSFSFFYCRFDKINNLVILLNCNTYLNFYSLVIYSGVYPNLYFLLIFKTYSHEVITINIPYYNFVTLWKSQCILPLWYDNVRSFTPLHLVQQTSCTKLTRLDWEIRELKFFSL